MATSLSSMVVFGVTSSSTLKDKGFRNVPTLLNSHRPCGLNSVVLSPHHFNVASHRWPSRSSFSVRATVLQEDEEKLAVEHSFPSRSSPGTGGRDDGDPPENSSSDGLQKWVIKIEQSINIFLTDTVIKILDTLYHDRHYARFFVLETIARVPYFAFMSVLHMYESFGWWRRADYLKVHFAESWNEMHHLLIMEELGGNEWWFDRFLAQHIAIFYYIMTVFMYALSPRMAYHFSECVESHAFETYDKFIKDQGEDLKNLPPSKVAVKYYTDGDMYLFDEFQTARLPNTRRPKIGKGQFTNLFIFIVFFPLIIA
ncbi:OLC1v1020783C2 [Oldenlandia corymbosa var. corymbosa]|uniref:Ubiquinol oxidase n=1 Tax=Oldenlandia corymbosa var. corymbosa TaxID=529605 RepID=A0AAV1BWL8_OLDCO|nr:OLC1v1020783C2 [Oldenlandia corymbosa var. corymbosa]